MNIVTSVFALLCLVITTGVSAQDTSYLSEKGHIPAEGLFELVYVPIQVPEGITEIRVNEIYSDTGRNVLNLGVFGPEGYQWGNRAGFRGWSGGAKKSFFINVSDASTGYIPGPVKPGTWNILIYPSTITPQGIDWRLEIALVKGAAGKPFEQQPAKEKIQDKEGWYRGDLHMHTYHSDGRRTQEQLLQEAASQNLDFIISTEHNTNSANLSWGKYNTSGLLVINGEEVTTTKYGHWNALGLNPTTWIEWRYAPKDSVVSKYIRQVHGDGGMAVINHPFYDKGVYNFGFDVAYFDGIEVWNGKWNQFNELALKWWDSLLCQGKHIIAIGASDSHVNTSDRNHLGVPHTVVKAAGLSRRQIMQSLKEGKAYLVDSSNISLSFSARYKAARADVGEKLLVAPGETFQVDLTMTGVAEAIITLHSEKGTILTEKLANPTQPMQWKVERATQFIRAEVRKPSGEMIAMTNPVWLVQKK
jgi:hypothetical protein